MTDAATDQKPLQDQEALQRAWQDAAVAQESQEAAEAALAHLQRRVVALNVEVRHRDARIAELEQELAVAQGGQSPDSGE